MQSLDMRSFFSSIEPFSSLENLDFLLENVDVEYFKKDELILKRGLEVEKYFLIIKGFVIEKEAKDEYFGEKDSFCAESLIENRARNSFYAGEECICYSIKRDVFMQLFNSNANFKKHHLNSVTNRFMDLIDSKQDEDLALFASTRIKDIYTHEPLIVDENISIIDGVKLMSEKKSDFLLVRFEDSFGIITNTNLREKVILNGVSVNEPISQITIRNLISIDENDFLFNALALMLQASISRLAVTKNGQIVGILEQLDILNSNKVHLINTRVQNASTLEELKKLVGEVEKIIKQLYKIGLNAKNIAILINEINRKIYKKTFELIMPQELQKNSAFMVMGSEGRSEQILKTDQDNALIVRDGFKIPNLDELSNKFTQTLLDFGFPKCKGNVMLCNPNYSKELKKYKNDILNFILKPSGDNFMNLAILLDASFISGDREIFSDFKDSLFAFAKTNPAFMPHFAKAALIFETPLSFFSNFITENEKMDIKKGAIFPIVHTIRALSLEMGIRETNTIKRIKELENLGYFSQNFSEELSQAFSFLQGLRLEVGLQSINQKKEVTTFLEPKSLNKFQRDLLRDTLKLVDKLKEQMGYHFKLSKFS